SAFGTAGQVYPSRADERPRFFSSGAPRMAGKSRKIFGPPAPLAVGSRRTAPSAIAKKQRYPLKSSTTADHRQTGSELAVNPSRAGSRRLLGACSARAATQRGRGAEGGPTRRGVMSRGANRSAPGP